MNTQVKSATRYADPPEPPDPPADVGALVRRHQAAIWRYLRVLGASPDTADELLQETFIALLRGDFEFRGEGATRRYLRETARRLWLGDRRRQRPVRAIEEADAVWEQVVGDGDGSEQVESLRHCLDELTPRAHTALLACRVEERPRDQVAAELELQPEGLKTLLRRTLEQLRECMGRRSNHGNA